MSFLDLTDVKADKFTPVVIKPGKYLVRCVEAEVKNTKVEGGKYINAKFRFVKEEYKDVSFFHTFNIENQSAKAKQIGLGQLKTFMEAAGAKEFKLESPADLVGLIALAQINTETYNGKEQIKIKYFIGEENNTPKGGDLFS
jgi:hypothetical protein